MHMAPEQEYRKDRHNHVLDVHDIAMGDAVEVVGGGSPEHVVDQHASRL